MANTLETLYEPTYKSFIHAPRKRALLIINNESAISNGYSLPKGMVFYTLPSQDYSNTDWLTSLAIHEFRHTVQWSTFLGKLLIPYHTLPIPWFFEGDAVLTETIFSNDGRGRIPSFSLLYRTSLLENKNISYSKQILGSLKEPVADFYKFGYFITCYLRKTYGQEFYDKITENKGLPFKTFSLEIEEQTGKSLEEIYEESNKELLKLWQAQLKGLKMTTIEYLKISNKIEETGYYFPKKINIDNNELCIAFNSGMDSEGYFVSIDKNGKETEILKLTSNTPRYEGFSVSNNLIAWTEEVPDTLWGSRGKSYSAIRIYNFETKNRTTINNKTRYAAARISPDGKRIVAVESDESYNHHLVILDIKGGEPLHRFQSSDNQFFKYPTWSPDGKKVAAIAIKNNQASIVILDIDSNTIKNLFPYNNEHTSRLEWYEDYLFYNNDYSGIDNIYALEILTGEIFQVTCRPYGAYNASIAANENCIYFNDFTKDGMKIAKMSLDPKSWKSIDKIEKRPMHYFTEISEQEGNSNILNKIPTKEYNVYEYPIFRNAISDWKIDLVPSLALLPELKIGIAASSNDCLNILTFKSGLYYDFEKNTIAIPFSIKYTGWYPILKIHAQYEYPLDIERKIKYLPEEMSEKSKKELIEKEEKKTGVAKKINQLAKNSLGFSITFPFSIDRFFMQQAVKIGIGTSLNHNYLGEIWIPQFLKLSTSHSTKTSPRDINPYFSQKLIIEGEYNSLIWKNTQKGFRITVMHRLTFPGFINHHSIVFKNAIQFRSNEYTCDSKYATHITQSKLLKDFKYSKDIFTVDFEYLIPLFYIDKGYKDIIMFQRFYTGLVFEYMKIGNLPIEFYHHPKTIGIKLVMEMNAITVPFAAGICPTYTFSRDKNKEAINDWGIQFIFNMKF